MIFFLSCRNFGVSRLLALCPRTLGPLFTRSNVNLAYKLHGEITSAIPIIILHGLLGSKKNWESMSRKMNKNSRRPVIAVDARNHGESPHVESHTYPELASDVSRLINKLSIDEAIIIGHSMGGRTGMVLALTEPSKVAGLVVLDISPVTTAGELRTYFPNILKAMRSINFKQKENIAKVRIEAKKNLETFNVDPDSIGFILMNIGIKPNKSIGWVCNIDVLNRHFVDIATFPSNMSGKQYRNQTLFIGGDRSKYIPSTDLEGIKKYFPNAELKYIANSGHNVHADNPDAFLKLILQFLLLIK